MPTPCSHEHPRDGHRLRAIKDLTQKTRPCSREASSMVRLFSSRAPGDPGGALMRRNSIRTGTLL
jgi:hypothetical protein